jgi:beta-lactamase regulating signal transducer with metallopeptidase domain
MTHTLQAIAWTLIHFCWEAAVIGALYGIANKLTMRRSSETRYLLALGALLAMVIAAAVTLTWQLLPATHVQGAVAEVAGDFPRMAEPGIAPSGTARVAAAVERVDPASRSMLWIDALWVLGVCGLSLRNLGGWWVIRRLRMRAAGLVPAEVQAAFERVASALDLHKDVLLRISDLVAGPVTVGAFRSVVLLPLSALTSLGTQELEVVLAHELAHVKRADFLWNLVQTVMETLFFFHPAVWWISGRVRHERELCCDDLALSVCPNPVVYASALYHLEEQRSRQMHLAMALDGHQTRQTLRLRIARVLGDTSAAPGRSEQPFSIAAVAAGVLVLLLSAPQVITSLHAMQPHTVAAPLVHAAAAVMAAPSAAVVAAPSPAAEVRTEAQASAQAPASSPKQEERPKSADTATQDADAAKESAPHSSYIDRMKAAGYDVDLDKLIAMKIQNITPEYARAMAQLGFGKPSADELIACKIQGVTPEAIAQFKQQGLEVKSLQDAISFRIFKVTPEFVAGMKAAGFDNIDSQKLVALRVQGVTPEYARGIKQQFPAATVDDLIETRIFKIDADFIASAKRHGFNDLSLKKLVQLRISGLLDDESK